MGLRLARIAILLANVFFNKENAEAAAARFSARQDDRPAPCGPRGPFGPGYSLLRPAVAGLRRDPTEPQRLILSLVHQLHLNYRVAFGTMVGYRMLPLMQTDYQSVGPPSACAGRASR